MYIILPRPGPRTAHAQIANDRRAGVGGTERGPTAAVVQPDRVNYSVGLGGAGGLDGGGGRGDGGAGGGPHRHGLMGEEQMGAEQDSDRGG